MPRPLAVTFLIALLTASAGCVAQTSTGGAPEAVRLAAGDNRHFAHTVEVAAPPARIWALWMDVSGWPSWDTELREASAPEPLIAGVEGRLVPRRGSASRFRVTMFEPGVRYAFETRLPGAVLRIVRNVTATESGSRFTHDVSFHGPLGWLFASRLGPGFRRALPVAMERLAAAARAR